MYVAFCVRIERLGHIVQCVPLILGLAYSGDCRLPLRSWKRGNCRDARLVRVLAGLVGHLMRKTYREGTKRVNFSRYMDVVVDLVEKVGSYREDRL